MRKMNKVVHFEIPYSDSKRVGDFYHNVFGWEINDAKIKGMEYKIAQTGETDENNMPFEPGFINGGLMPKTDLVQGPVIAMQVEDIQEAVKLVESSGGSKLMEPLPVGTMGFYVYVKDSEGNVIGMWEDKK